MKKIILFLLSCTFFILSITVATAQTAKKPELLTKETFLKKVWNFQESPNEFKYLGDKPCIIDFYADWCGYCRRIAPFMDDFCKVYDKNIYVYKINIDQQKELQSLFQIRSLPTVMYIPQKGAPTLIQGALSKKKYETYIKKLLIKK